jgi:hypothetical protein
MSVIKWEGHRPESLEKLKEALDLEFEYIGCPFSMSGFRDIMKQFMKTERSRLKEKYLARDTQCPLHIQPTQWENLLAYLARDTLQVAKTKKMANARHQVRNASHVGRKGKGGREAKLVRDASANLPFCNIKLYLCPVVTVNICYAHFQLTNSSWCCGRGG